MKILMVCLGNICRSPLAEGIMRRKIKEHDLDWEVDSAGTGSWHVGEQPDPRSIQVARNHDLDITRQRARQFRTEDLDRFDLVLVMDRSNYTDVLDLSENEQQKKKVEMIMRYAGMKETEEVPDPYWNDDGFEQVYQMLEEACDAIVERHRS